MAGVGLPKPHTPVRGALPQGEEQAEGILQSVELGVSSARVEAANNKIKVTIRQGYGFLNVDNLIVLVMLRCSDLKPSLPGCGAA